MNIKMIFPILASVLMIGCATKNTVPVAIPIAPIKTESVQPSLKKVQTGIDQSVDSNSKIEQKLKTQIESVTNQKVEIENALAQAEKIKENVLAKQAITEIEATNLVDQINKVKTRNLFLETQNTDLKGLQEQQLVILKQTQDSAHDTALKLQAKESEAVDLRNYSQFLASNLQKKNDEVVGLNKDLTKEKQASARANVYRNWTWGIVGIFLLWTIIKNILMIYLPTTKFRI